MSRMDLVDELLCGLADIILDPFEDDHGLPPRLDRIVKELRRRSKKFVGCTCSECVFYSGPDLPG